MARAKDFPRQIFKESDLDRYSCVKCDLLLQDPVQLGCGHRVCKHCADELIDNAGEITPQCPECEDEISEEDGMRYFPDRFVRREILNLSVVCIFSHLGCNWEGKYEHYQQHIYSCQFATLTCQHCGENVPKCQMPSHSQSCQYIPRQCPLAHLGCTKVAMVSDKLQQHLNNNTLQHLTIIMSCVSSIERIAVNMGNTKQRNPDFVEADGAVLTNRYDSVLGQSLGQQSRNKTQLVAHLQERVASESVGLRGDHVTQVKLESTMAEMKKELMRNFRSELRVKDEEITGLKTQISKLEKMLRSKSAELDFSLSLVKNCNYDGTMIWKIPQFSQRKVEAENGKYTSIFSLPFTLVGMATRCAFISTSWGVVLGRAPTSHCSFWQSVESLTTSSSGRSHAKSPSSSSTRLEEGTL